MSVELLSDQPDALFQLISCDLRDDFCIPGPMPRDNLRVNLRPANRRGSISTRCGDDKSEVAAGLCKVLATTLIGLYCT